MFYKYLLATLPAIVISTILLLISGITMSAVIGSLVTGIAYFVFINALLTEEKQVIEIDTSIEHEEEIKLPEKI